MESLPVNNKAAGEPESTYNRALETGAAATQVQFGDLTNYHDYG